MVGLLILSVALFLSCTSLSYQTTAERGNLVATDAHGTKKTDSQQELDYIWKSVDEDQDGVPDGPAVHLTSDDSTLELNRMANEDPSHSNRKVTQISIKGRPEKGSKGDRGHPGHRGPPGPPGPQSPMRPAPPVRPVLPVAVLVFVATAPIPTLNGNTLTYTSVTPANPDLLSTGIFTATEAGIYSFSFEAHYSGLSSILTIEKNDMVARSELVPLTSPRLSVTTFTHLVPGDKVKVCSTGLGSFTKVKFIAHSLAHYH